MAAQTFSARIDEATLGVAAARRAAVRTAFTDFQTALAIPLTAYSLNAQDTQAVDDKLIDIARYLEAAMR